MDSRFICLSFLVAFTALLLKPGNALPVQTDTGKENGHIQMEQLVTAINENLLAAESDARISRLFYTRNATFNGEDVNLPKEIFSELLLSSGFEKMEGAVPMTWEEIMVLHGPFDGNHSSKCHEVFHPDHLLSKVTLENLINGNAAMEKKVMDQLKQLFCRVNVDLISMYYMQTDDVISGLIVLCVMDDQSLLALANVGF